MIDTMPVVQVVSQATLACLSCAKIASKIASETQSQTLSGCPSVTDYDVKNLLAIIKPPYTTNIYNIHTYLLFYTI
jgi:hypothetical protein